QQDQADALATRARSLEKEIDKRSAELAAALKQVQDLLAAKERLQGRLQQGDKVHAETLKQLALLVEAKARLEGQLQAAAKDLAAAQRTMAGLEGQTRRLGDEVRAARAEAEKRFAGIALTGERVLFLLDMSGSMRMRDPSTSDETKWPQVCETLGHV